jgi:prephenate dehydrogenase
MGRFFTRLLSDAGCSVKGYDRLLGPISWEEAALADVVLVSVPVPAFGEVMEALGPHTRASGAVVDICSLKERPLEAMKAHCRGALVAAHPLFGPYVESLEGRTLFLCHGGETKWGEWFTGLMEGLGVKIVRMGAREHDRLMAVVQSLRHVVIACLGDALGRAGFDAEWIPPEYCGPWFDRLRELLVNQAEQDGGLYADLALSNRAVGPLLDFFAQSLEEARALVGSSQREGLARFFNRASGLV